MRYTFLGIAATILLFFSCKKTDDNSPDGGNSCASNTSVCFKLGDTTRSFQATWYSILGNGRSIAYSDSIHDFSMDVGSSDKRDFSISSGSLWSGGARMSYYNKKNGKTYKAYRGRVTITSVDNDLLSGTFEGAARNTSNANDTLLIQNGSISSVMKQ